LGRCRGGTSRAAALLSAHGRILMWRRWIEIPQTRQKPSYFSPDCRFDGRLCCSIDAFVPFQSNARGLGVNAEFQITMPPCVRPNAVRFLLDDQVKSDAEGLPLLQRIQHQHSDLLISHGGI
jgi:hypothetical protein